LFIDSSNVSLKAELLHKGNKFPPVSLAQAANMTESYENMKLLLEKIHYEKYNWKICGGLKVIVLLLCFTHLWCFLCECDSRDRKHHYIHKQWPKRKSLTPGQKTVVNTPSINREKVSSPPLHKKLRLLKNFFKSMDQNSAGIKYLKNMLLKSKKGCLLDLKYES
jgi:hypothetical protein